MISIIDSIKQKKKKRKTKNINVNSQMVKMRIEMICTIEKDWSFDDIIDRLSSLFFFTFLTMISDDWMKREKKETGDSYEAYHHIFYFSDFLLFDHAQRSFIYM
jgi:hypothetical protein